MLIFSKGNGTAWKNISSQTRCQGGTSTSKPNQVHHYASDKSKTYTQAFKDITDKYGLDIDADWNYDRVNEPM